MVGLRLPGSAAAAAGGALSQKRMPWQHGARGCTSSRPLRLCRAGLAGLAGASTCTQFVDQPPRLGSALVVGLQLGRQPGQVQEEVAGLPQHRARARQLAARLPQLGRVHQPPAPVALVAPRILQQCRSCEAAARQQTAARQSPCHCGRARQGGVRHGSMHLCCRSFKLAQLGAVMHCGQTAPAGRQLWASARVGAAHLKGRSQGRDRCQRQSDPPGRCWRPLRTAAAWSAPSGDLVAANRSNMPCSGYAV